MKPWKRNALIVFLICTLAVAIVFLAFGMGSAVPGIVKALFVLMALVVLAGLGVGAYAVVWAFLHERATLHAGPEGVINIERSALESTARRALASIEGVSYQKVVARVVEREDGTVIDVTVTAVPYGAESLMVTAGRIQTAIKRALESFTDHEVRYVAVNFVEPRKRDEVKAAVHSEEVRAAAGYVPPKYPGFKGSVASEGESARKPVGAGIASAWQRVKDKAAELRDKYAARDEDVIEADAQVVGVEFVDDHRAAQRVAAQPCGRGSDTPVRDAATGDAGERGDVPVEKGEQQAAGEARADWSVEEVECAPGQPAACMTEEEVRDDLADVFESQDKSDAR